MYVANSFGRPPKLKGKRVLVVEDEALVSMLVEDELRDAGATVLGPAVCVGDAMRLVEAAAADGGMDAAVLDLNLQGERATPVADRLAALGVPFLFATGYGEGCDTGGHGAAPTLHKPFDPERLVAAVEALASAGAARDRKGHEQSRHTEEKEGGGHVRRLSAERLPPVELRPLPEAPAARVGRREPRAASSGRGGPSTVTHRRLAFAPAKAHVSRAGGE